MRIKYGTMHLFYWPVDADSKEMQIVNTYCHLKKHFPHNIWVELVSYGAYCQSQLLLSHKLWGLTIDRDFIYCQISELLFKSKGKEICVWFKYITHMYVLQAVFLIYRCLSKSLCAACLSQLSSTLFYFLKC